MSEGVAVANGTVNILSEADKERLVKVISIKLIIEYMFDIKAVKC